MKLLFLILLFLLLIGLIINLFISLYWTKKTLKYFYASTKRITHILDSVRYGNLSLRFDSKDAKFYPEVAESINRMIETIQDREYMIEEYQKDLFQRNKNLEDLIEKEKEAIKLKEDFITTLTHDLKVPLIAAGNVFDYLLDGNFGQINSSQIEAVTNLKNSNRELIELVETLLETYKSSESEIKLYKDKYSVNKIIEETITEMTPVAMMNNQKLSFNPDRTYEYKVDKFQFKRVIKNLTQNAILHGQENTEINIYIYEYENKLNIRFINFGYALNEEDLQNIFDKYYSNVKKYRRVGTGLGLYLSNKIIQAHGGEINAKCEDEDKVMFTIELPL